MNNKKIKEGNTRAKKAVKGAFHSFRVLLSKKLGQWDGRMNTHQKWLFYTVLLFTTTSLLTWNLFSTFNNPSEVSAGDIYGSMEPYGIKMEKMPRYDPVKGRAIAVFNYLDSLKNNATTRERYDSILNTRPGLMDSITYYINR